jgi:hypothetical protein
MSEPRTPKSPARPTPAPRPAEPAAPRPAPPPRDRERAWTVGEDGVVDEPSDRSGPRFDDDLDPADAP